MSPRTAASLAVGTMNFGKRTSAGDAERIVHRALERGLTFFDTANVYNDGESERILGRALRGKRDGCTVASKVGLARLSGRPEGLSAVAITRALEGTLERLGTDRVDVYYLHAPDHVTPIEETLGAIHALLDAGKVRAWGVSNYASWQMLEMMHLCDAQGMPRPVMSQVIYNLLVRQIEIEHLSFAERHAVQVTVYNPLAGGLLAGKYDHASRVEKGSRFDGNAMYQRRYWSPKMFDLVDTLGAIAKGAGMSLIALAYAWVSHRKGVASVLVGPASVEHLEAAIEGSVGVVSADVLAKIDEAYRAWTGTDTNYVR